MRSIASSPLGQASVAHDPFIRESAVRSYCRSFPTTFARAQGSHLFDSSGRRFIDFLAGCSALNYGHNDPDMTTALIDYLSSAGIAHGLDLHTEAKGELLETLTQLILEPRGLSHKVQFTGPTGTNAVEAAIKLARKVTGRTQIVAFTGGFHGVTAGALAATGNRAHRMAPTVPLPGVSRAPYDGYLGPGNDTADLLDRLLSDPSSGYDPPAAILLETVQGEGGLTAASAPWLCRVAEIARSSGALLIVDDIQAGCGRTGSFFSFEPMGIEPDIITLSKSISGFGLPLALVLLRPELDRWNPGEHNGTFRGNNLAFVTATVALRKFWSDETLSADVHRRAAIITEALTRLQLLIPGSRLCGRGMMLGLDVRSGELAAKVCDRCFSNGLVIETSGAHSEVIKILAPLTIADETLREGLAILEAAVAAHATALTPTS